MRILIQFPGLSQAEAEALSATITVCNANTVLKETPIGCFTFDAIEVYNQPNACYFERWIGLVNPLNENSRGIRGFLRVTLYVVGPGDNPPPRFGATAQQMRLDGKAESAATEAASGAKTGSDAVVRTAEGVINSMTSGANALVKNFRKKKLEETDDGIERDVCDETTADALLLLPPFALRTLRWLVVGIFQGRGLPVIDSLPPGIDAFVECSFGGCSPIRTQFVTRRVRSGMHAVQVMGWGYVVRRY